MRFVKIIEKLPKCDVLAEVGCDHAKLTQLAYETGKCRKAIVSDISATCLNKAKKTLIGYPQTEYYVCDGIPQAAFNADYIMICGMGGHLISDIISRYDGSAGLLIGPQSHAETVRGTLGASGYKIIADECFKAEGKFYDVILAVRGSQSLTPMQKQYGIGWQDCNEALYERLSIRLANLEKGGNKTRAEADRIREVLKCRK